MSGTSDVHHQAYVNGAWELIHTMERVGVSRSAEDYALRWEASRQKGEDFYAQVAVGEGAVADHQDVYESQANLTRFARTIDFLRPGERIMEIGIGKGFLALMALRAGRIGAYRGIELLASNVVDTNTALAAAGYADRATAEEGNLYDLTQEMVADHGTDLVICCEVLEHLPDPEAALKVLADSLPDGTDLLVSVPLRGRLEGVWGHVAQFGVARVREMVHAAGLTVHHVEPLANTWVFLLASRSAHSDRAALAVAAEPDVTAGLVTPDDWSRSVENVEPEPIPSRWMKNLATYSVEPAEQGVRLRATAVATPEDEGSRYAGIAFACDNARGIRFEIDPVDIGQVEAFYADFYAGQERIGRWKWVPSERQPKQDKPTFMLQPQNKGLFFQRQKAQDLRTADRFELFAQLPPGGSVTVDVTQLGWVR